MPLTLSGSLQAHLDGEVQTLCTLWTIERRNGTVLRFTDHDKDLYYGGNTYVAGIGYDRSAIEDKMDLSVDNMDIKGLFDESLVKRSDLRGGMYDGARVRLEMINYKDLTQGTIVRRTGWLGSTKQNTAGQFEVELRGLSQALTETMTRIYAPGCTVDFGSTLCQVALLEPSGLPRGEAVARHTWYSEPAYPDYVWRVDQAGTLGPSVGYNSAIYNASSDGEQVTDGTAILTAVLRYDRSFTVSVGGDRKRFTVTLTEPRLATYADWYTDGALKFTSGDNNLIAKGVKHAVEISSGEVEIEMVLRMPFNVENGDTGTIIPGCRKTVMDCGNKFGNILNFQGQPYVPGENYLKKYPNSK